MKRNQKALSQKPDPMFLRLGGLNSKGKKDVREGSRTLAPKSNLDKAEVVKSSSSESGNW